MSLWERYLHVCKDPHDSASNNKITPCSWFLMCHNAHNIQWAGHNSICIQNV